MAVRSLRAHWDGWEMTLGAGSDGPVGATVVFVGDHDVPAVEAVLATIEDHHSGLPSLVRFVAAEMAAAAAIHADDVLRQLHLVTVTVSGLPCTELR